MEMNYREVEEQNEQLRYLVWYSLDINVDAPPPLGNLAIKCACQVRYVCYIKFIFNLLLMAGHEFRKTLRQLMKDVVRNFRQKPWHTPFVCGFMDL